jgi:hypothetical protein
MRLFLTAIMSIGVMASGCASNVNTRYTGPLENKNVGVVKVVLTEAMDDVAVTVNGHLVTSKNYTELITIQSVPAGKVDIQVSADNWSRSPALDETRRISLDANDHQTVVINTPSLSTAYWAYMVVLVGIAVIIPAATSSSD